MRRTGWALAAALMAAAHLSAENWPAWRGPADAGISSERNLPTTWSDASNVLWNVPLRGLGVSTPVVWGTRIFVTAQEGYVAERSGSHPTLIQGIELPGSGERT